jgi:ABC-2 type transport system permease protein
MKMLRRPILLMGSVVLPLIALAFMATIFGRGTMDRLPVGIVDHDATVASRSLVRRVDASPSLRVAGRYTDEAAAREAVRRKQIYGYLRIPYRYEQDLGAGRRPTLLYVYHYAFLGVGSRVNTAFRTALVGDSMPFLGISLPVYNTQLNYVVYLAYPFYFVLLQALCLLTVIYAWKSRTPAQRRAMHSRSFLQRIGAVAGFLVPYTVAYSLVSLVAHGVFFGWMGVPSGGAVGWLWVLSVVFVVAMEAMALLICKVVSDFGTAMSVGSMTGSLGATLSGITFPLSALPWPVEMASRLFPVRYFVEAMQQLLYIP